MAIWLLVVPAHAFAAATIPPGCSIPGSCTELTPRFQTVSVTGTASGHTVHANTLLTSSGAASVEGSLSVTGSAALHGATTAAALTVTNLTVNGASTFRGSASGLMLHGSNHVTSSGSMFTRLGATTRSVRVGGILPGLPKITAVGNVGDGEDDLMTYTIPANTFASNGDTVTFELAFSISPAIVTAAGVEVYFNGTAIDSSGLVFGSGSPMGGGPLSVTITRLNSNTAVISGIGGDPNTDMATLFEMRTGLNFTNALVFKATGQSVDVPADDDIVQRSLVGWYYPANP